MRALPTGLVVATLLLILAASTAPAQQQPATSQLETKREPVRRELCIAAAAGAETDEETWARLVSGYANEKEGFVRLLLDLEANQIDYAYDSLSDIRGKRAAIGRSYHRNLRSVLDRRRNSELEIDYLRVAWEVMPRLTGRVVKVGPGENQTTLDQALVMLKAGDRIELQAGTYELTLEDHGELPSDVALVGRGPERTTLTFTGENHGKEVDRWRFSNVSLTCEGSQPFSSGVTPPGLVHVDRCKITGFDFHQGAFAGGGVLLIEDCVAEGEADHFGADIFDAHSHRSWLAIYLRRCEFSNIDDLAMHMQAPMVVDRCRFARPQDRFGRRGPFQQKLVDVHGSNLWLRDSVGIDAQSGKAFTDAVDDEATMQYVLGKQHDFSEDVDPRIIELNSQLQLRRNPFYWIGLLRHADDEVRRTAAAKISELLPVRVVPPEQPQIPPQSELAQEIAAAIEALDSDQFAERQRAQKKLLQIGKPAVVALKNIAEEGALEQRTRAEQILVELGEIASSAGRPELPNAWELEYGRVSRWYAEHRRGLMRPH